ncbi:MAG: hypothetical protein LC723_05590 [Actinobacteria bacterium]|nr:hypothetical protein [Actinomycetota bacterium]
MACFRCERIQTDPAKGASPWVRLVVQGEQVLLCPICQSEVTDFYALGDRCPECSSTRLNVVMDSVICKSCGRDYDRAEFKALQT